MDSSKIISLEDFARNANRYPSEEEALRWSLLVCDLLETKSDSYPLLSPKNVYIENDNRWVTANPPTTTDAGEALFRAGSVLYFLITRDPFQISHYLDGPPSIRERNPQISVRFESIVLRLLQNVRALRYASVPEVRDDMQRLLKELSGDWPLHWSCFKGNSARTNCLAKAAIDPVGKTLKEVWKARIGEIWASPVMAGESIFIGSADGNFYSIDANTGKVVWKLSLGSRVESTACIQGNTAYLGNDLGNFHAINIRNGSLLWKKSLGEYVRSSPACDNKNVYVGSINPTKKSGMLWAISRENGATIWKKAMGPIFASPALDQGEIFVGSDDEIMYCINTSGEEKWKSTLSGKIRSTAVLVKDFVYVGGFGGVFYKLRRLNGLTAWRNEDAGSMYSSPGYGRSFLVAGNNAGQVVFLQVNAGKKKAEFATGGPVTASPLVVQQYVLIGSNDGKFYILDNEGKSASIFDAQSPVNSSACYRDNMIYVGCDSGLLALSLS